MPKRIEIFAIGTQGDVRPCVALGQGLLRAGYPVGMATSGNFAGLVRDAGLESAGRRGPGGRLPISYSRKVFIPLTHLCRDYCGYCTFRADPKPGVAAYMTPDEVLAVAEAGAQAGARIERLGIDDPAERALAHGTMFGTCGGWKPRAK